MDFIITLFYFTVNDVYWLCVVLCSRKQEDIASPLDAASQVVVSHLAWVLGTELRLSVKACVL